MTESGNNRPTMQPTVPHSPYQKGAPKQYNQPTVAHRPAAPRVVNHAPPARPSIPAPVNRPQPQRPYPPQNARPHPRDRKSSANSKRMLLYGFIILLLMGFLMVGALVLGVGLVYAQGILPGVSVGGVAVGGRSIEQATHTLSNSYGTIILRDGEREWPVTAALLGVTVDARRTAEAAYEQGRGAGDIFGALLGTVEIAPIMTVDFGQFETALTGLSDRFYLPPTNARIRLVDGRVEGVNGDYGRTVDVGATIGALRSDTLIDGAIELVMASVAPDVQDATPLVEAATRLLSSPLDIHAYDPITDETLVWSIPPSAWGQWMTATVDESTASGLSLSVDGGMVRDFLNGQANALGSSRYLNVDEAVASVQQSVAGGRVDPLIRVYHHDSQHTVQPGESFASIAYDYGIPYPWIQAANPGVEGLSVGQVITVPSPDQMLPLPIVPNKRIVVSISEQRVRVYENGALIWDWGASTGIPSSPTAPGVFQIQSHEPSAYAGNWNLDMPYFMGVYRPVPSSDFMNGFHGFPTRGGTQLLWTNSIGTRVTYGCILIADQNVQLLYAWADEGTVVEIRP